MYGMVAPKKNGDGSAKCHRAKHASEAREDWELGIGLKAYPEREMISGYQARPHSTALSSPPMGSTGLLLRDREK